ncbi:MAG: DUF302 domain-containing protein [Cyclobacteriaceae bacterium]|mgnify:CR=1 FL=1|jgi:uncharacterized protein (DUF302 family)
MEFFIAKKFQNADFSDMDAKVREELKKEGFGVITEIDIKKTLKEKIDVEFRNYTIIGACNPAFAYKALQAEDKIGILLPCNVVIQETKNGEIEVLAFDPASVMMTMESPELDALSSEVREMLTRVLDNLN